MKNAKTMLRKILLIGAVITAMTVTGCKQPVKKDKGGEVKTFAVTVTQSANGTITVKKGGEFLNEAALKAVKENTELEITLIAKSGYKAVKLVINGKPETNSAGGKTIVKKVKVTQALTVSGNVVKESTPLKTFAVTVTQPTNGTITVKKGGELLNGAALKAVEENTELEITLTAKDGYKTVKLVVGDEEKTESTDNGKTITKKVTVTKALTVSGEVAKDTVKVIVRGDDHVTVNEPKNFEVKLGSDWKEVKKKINVVYAVGWEEAGWHIKDKDGGTLTESFTFTKDTIVFAVSKKSLEKFKVTLTPPEHGRIKVLKGGIELSQTELNGILEGTVLTFVLEANEGYKPTVLTVNGEKYKIPNGNSISATVEITKNTEASGEVKRILKIAVTKPENGSIGVTKKGVIVFESEYGKLQEGTELTFKLSANTGYKVKSLTIAQEGGNTDNYTDVENGTISHTLNITANLTVSGIVEKDTAHNTLESEKIDVDEVSFNMVKIPAANNITFIKKTISLSAYRIAETEVTQKLYQKIMGENPSHFTSEPAAGETQELRPVEKVSWYEAAAFCNELTKKIDGNTANCVYYSDKAKQNAYTKEDGKAGNPVHADWTKTGYRLPTEAEWEYAAKGGTTHKYSGSDNLEDVAWGGLSTDFKTHEVKKKAKNGYGLYDMSGNVGEWCWDWYVKFPPLEGQNSKDPKGPETGTNKMERGGDFSYTTYTNLDYACTNRDETSVSVTPNKKEDYIGFRLARNGGI